MAEIYKSKFPGQEIDERLELIPEIQEGVEAAQQAADGKYTKPASGIPMTDLSDEVQEAIQEAGVQADWEQEDTTAPDYIKKKPSIPTHVVRFVQQFLSEVERIQARANIGAGTYSKPALGIPAEDIADDVIPDVSDFITNTVNDLVNYYRKSETYNRSEVQQLIAAIQGVSFISVASLPTPSADTMGGKIYLVPSTNPDEQNVKDEFITVQDGSTYTWEQIGSTKANLSGYVTIQQLNNALAAYTTTEALTTLLAAKQDTIPDLSTIRSGAAAGATAYQKPQTGIPASDLASGVIPTVPTDIVKYSSQSLTDAQQTQARTNIGAAAAAALTALETAIAAKYTKPSSGIPETDLASGVQSALALARTSIQSLAAYYTKTEIDSLLAAVNSEQYVDVATLPTASASTLGKIYLVGPTNGVYDRYYTSYDGSTYSWVPVGNTEINLANYATKEELSQLSAEVNGKEEEDIPVSETATSTKKHLGINGEDVTASSGTSIVRTFPAIGGAKYLITGRVGTVENTCLVVFRDSENTVLAYYYPTTGESVAYPGVTVTAPAGAVTMRVAGNTSPTAKYDATVTQIIDAIVGLSERVDDVEQEIDIGGETELTPDIIHSGVYINKSTGEFVDGSVNARVYEYQGVSPYISYAATGGWGANVDTCAVSYFDAAGNFISSEYQSSGTAGNVTKGALTVPANCRIIRVWAIISGTATSITPALYSTPHVGPVVKNVPVEVGKLYVRGAAKNTGKTVGVFGGSISVRSESQAAKAIWSQMLGVTITDYGVAGYGFSSLQGSIQDEVDGATSKDIFILWASTNDYRNDRACGTWQDYTALDNYDESKRVTQCGGLNYCIKTLLELNPEAEIYFFTPLRFFISEDGWNPYSAGDNGTGKNFAAYIDEMKKCCAYYGVTVLDQFNLANITPLNYSHFYQPDKLHLNSEGYRRVGWVQADFLANGK